MTDYDRYAKAESLKYEVVKWIKSFFDENGPDCKAVVGISGGKDSTVVAALCVEALGKERVFGVLMPNGEQKDIGDAMDVCKILDIDHTVVDIFKACKSIHDEVKTSLDDHWSKQSSINLPPRIRMATLYAVSQTINGRVANTCNLSEDWVGYSTRYGDSVGDFSPLSNMTTDEVVAVGYACGLPKYLVEKVPSDGLCGKTDEDNLGFTYAVLNKYIRTGVCDDAEIKKKIDTLHEKNAFKLKPMPSFTPPADMVF